MEEIHQKMHLFDNHHQGDCWHHQVMKDVHENFESMLRALYNASRSGFCQLRSCSELFFRCMLKWCVEEDGTTINQDLVDILTDVETHMANAIRFCNYDNDNDYNNIDHLLPRMAKACLHVLAAESSPPNFILSNNSIDDYNDSIRAATGECWYPFSRKIKDQVENVYYVPELVRHTMTMDKIENTKHGQELLICAESLLDKVACHVFLGCWESYCNMYLSSPSYNIESMIRVGIQKVLVLQSDAYTPLTHDEALKDYIKCVQQNLMDLMKDQSLYLTRRVTHQLKILHCGMRILVNFNINCPAQLYAEGQNLVDVIVEVQTVARTIAATATKVSLGLQNLLASLLKVWVVQLKNCTTLPLSDAYLIQFMECIQQIMSEMLKDENFIQGGSVKNQLKMLHNEMEILVNFHSNYPLELYAKEESNHINVRVEVQTIARKIASFIYSSIITQTEENSVSEKASLGVQILLTSVLKAWVVQLRSCTTLPLTDEFLLQFMDSVQRILGGMLEDWNIIQRGTVRDQLVVLHHEMVVLVNFHINYPSELYAGEGPNLVDIRLEVQSVVKNVASFIYSSFSTQAGENSAATKMIFCLPNLLTTILKAWELQLTISTRLPFDDEFLIQFKECIRRIMNGILRDEAIEVRHQFRNLDDSIGVWLDTLFKYKPNLRAMKENPCNIRIQVLVLMRTIASTIHSFVDNQTKENSGPTMNFPLSDLVEKIAFLKAQVMEIIFPILVPRFRQFIPRTNQLGLFDFLLANMKELASGGSDWIAHWKDKFQGIYNALILFRDFFQSMTDNSSAYSRDICDRIANVAYEAEYLMYSLCDGSSYPPALIALWISDFSQHVELTKASLRDIFDKNDNDGEITINSVGDLIHVSSQALIPTIDFVVGFEGEMQHIKHQLISHMKQLDVVSIIGMPGLGKTTLAKKVYEYRLITDYFQIRAWCCFSNDYNKKELLLTILGCIIEVTDRIRKMKEVDLSTILHKELMGRRYLVVLDDVWGIDAFEWLKIFLPDSRNGSRIMLTSRNKVIGLKAKHHSDPLELRLLTDDESWDLLSWKVYHKQESPLELCQVGKKIAQNCKGLPLAIVVVAGLLAKSDKKLEFWEQVAKNMSLYMALDSQTQGMAVLELSYKFLPSHLKPLFLYIGAFPEDTEIPVEKLIWLWIAEGFVRDTKLRSLEVQAEMYLMDLIDRNFLMVAARRSDGRVKTCIVHDLLRDMSLLKAKEEHLFQQINVSDDLPDLIFYQNRLSIHLQRSKNNTPTLLYSERPFIACEDLSILSLTPPVYSFLFFNKNKSLPLWEKAVESVLCELRLLRVLHFETTKIDVDLCNDLMVLVHLRYLSILAPWTSIPLTISKLWNLQTLIIKGLRGEILVPDVIWEMVQLRHLHINYRAKFNAATNKSFVLGNLETLSTPVISHGEEEKLMRRLPRLQKLRCNFLESWDPYRNCYSFPQLNSPDQLESLKVIYIGTARCVGQFVVPLSLKKLSLSKFRLKWDEISMFQSLPELEVLNLRFGAVDGELWNMDEDEQEGFPKLKFLKLESLNFKKWSACAENFPCLENLVIKKCKQLEEIPNELGDINSLQKIEMLWCSNSVASMAKMIEKEQENAGNELLKVHIYPPVMNSESSS